MTDTPRNIRKFYATNLDNYYENCPPGGTNGLQGAMLDTIEQVAADLREEMTQPAKLAELMLSLDVKARQQLRTMLDLLESQGK